MVLLVLAAGCRPSDPHRDLVREWSEGPARWLVLPEERKALDHLRPGEWSLFLEQFWSRRSRLAPRFEGRVAAADRLYAEPGSRGALTDRGGALILLGDPGHLQVGELTVPTPRGRDGTRRTGKVPMEVWIYDTERLDPPLAEPMEAVGEALRLVFVREGNRTRLVEGHDALALAARAWVDSESESPFRGGGAMPRGAGPPKSPAEIDTQERFP